MNDSDKKLILNLVSLLEALGKETVDDPEDIMCDLGADSTKYVEVLLRAIN